MTKTLFLILAGVLATILVRWGWNQVFSFRAQAPELYAEQTPKFDIREALNGPMVADGVIYDFAGRVSSRLTAELLAEWNGNEGTLSEKFVYSSGAIQNRKWALSVGQDGQITGTADDIVGQATGQQAGAAVSLKYRLVLPDQVGGYRIDVTDWMYLTESGTVVNRAEFRKFGIKVGELVATFRKVE